MLHSVPRSIVLKMSVLNIAVLMQIKPTQQLFKYDEHLKKKYFQDQNIAKFNENKT